MGTKERWIAMLLSILIMGVGHFYIGKYKKALFVLLSPLIFVALITLFFWKTPIIAISLFIIIGVTYLYGILDVWRSFPLEKESPFYTRWYFVLLYIVIAFIIQSLFSWTIAKSFVTHSTSMGKTIMKGDTFYSQKNSQVKRGDVVTFRYPLDPNIFFVKRLVAKEGDELVYQDKHLYIHFSEGDDFMIKEYTQEKLLEFQGKLWIDNPYKIGNKKIQYNPKDNNAFQNLINFLGMRTDMKPIYIKELGEVLYELKNGVAINAFYKKVEENHYYVIGDNRDNSADSRFWGSVPSSYIYGIAKIIYFNKNDLSRIGMEIK